MTNKKKIGKHFKAQMEKEDISIMEKLDLESLPLRYVQM